MTAALAQVSTCPIWCAWHNTNPAETRLHVGINREPADSISMALSLDEGQAEPRAWVNDQPITLDEAHAVAFQLLELEALGRGKPRSSKMIAYGPGAAPRNRDAEPAAFVVRAADLAEIMARQERFAASRPPCPAWCTGECDEDSNDFGDAALHGGEVIALTSTAESENRPAGVVTLRPWSYDGLDEESEIGIELDVSDANWIIPGVANFTPEQARQLAAELVRLADQQDPEQKVPAEQVRVGDWFPVGAEWLYVYCVDVDEPSNRVAVFTTVDRQTWPEIDNGLDEEPHDFEFGQLVRVRRGGAR